MRLSHRAAAAALLLCLSASAALNLSIAGELKGTAHDRLLNDLKYLSSDDLEGRGVGTKGLNLAADFVRKAFADAGLDVTAVDGGAFQKFSMVTGATQGERNSLAFSGPDGKTIGFDAKDFQVCSFGGSGKLSGEIVFGGYAISAKDVPYIDLDGVDVKGKTVIVMRRNPQQDNKKSPFAAPHGGVSRHAALRTKISICSTAGAAAILFVNDPHSIEASLEKRFDEAHTAVVKAAREYANTKPDDESFPEKLKNLQAALKLVNAAHCVAHSPNGGDELMKFGYNGYGRDGAIPIIHISRAKCDELLKAAAKTSLADLESQIDATLKPASQLLKGWTIEGETEVERIRTEVKNVVGVLQGSGEHADETIVVGAHYDHVGRGGAGSLAPGSKEIHNGADDNGSGTVALIELARRLASREEKLPRRVVFIAFTAEELGLIGSAKYVEKPVFELKNTIAMYNMDMVGRLRDDKLTVFGVGTSPTFKDDVTRFGESRDLKLSLKPEGFGPSDQSSFYARKIPVLHFFTGTHSDYHRPGDDWEKININGIDRIAALVEDVVVHTALTNGRPKYIEVKSRAQIARSGNRPYFGSIPDFGSEETGYSISGVSPGSPAAKGGLKGGDHIIQLGKHRISDLNDFDLALRAYKPGEEVPVTVRRDGKEVKLKVKLAKPR